MASLFKDIRTGLFAVQFYDAARRPPKRRVSTGVRDQRAAERIRRFWEAEYAEGKYDPWIDSPPVFNKPSRTASRPCTTVGEARLAFLSSRAHRAKNTRANYERVTQWFMNHVGAETAMSALGAAEIEGWLDTTRANVTTRANYVRHLRAFYRYCVAEGLAAKDVTPDVRLERVPKTFPKALSPEEVERIAEYAEHHAKKARWLAPFVRIAAHTALRRNELLNLRWEHLDLERAVLVVACTDQFTSKSGAERVVPLSEPVVRVLRGLAAQRVAKRGAAVGYVFEHAGGQVAPNTASHTLKRFARKAGVPCATVHALRHSCLTWLAQAGVPVPAIQRLAGHGDISVTMRYVHLAPDVTASLIRGALDRRSERAAST